MPSFKAILPFIIFIIIALAIVHFTYQGADLKFDDANYLLYGHQMLNGTFNISQSPYAYGSLYISTIAAGLWLTHGQAWGASLPQILEYILIICITYLCLLKFFDKDVSFIVALGAEISAFGALYITRVLPDMALGLIIATIFLIFTYKAKDGRFLFLAGLLSGLMVSIKLGGFVLLILLGLNSAGIYGFMAVAIIIISLILIEDVIPRNKTKSSHRGLYGFGLFSALALYQFLLPKGLNLFAMAHIYDTNQVFLSQATLSLNIQAAMINLFGYAPPFFQQIFPLGAIAIFAVLGTVLILLKKQKQLYFVVITFWLAVLYLYFGTESFISYTFIVVVSRYFVEFLAPMALLAAVGVNHIIKTKKQMARVLLLGAILFLIGISNIIPYLILLK